MLRLADTYTDADHDRALSRLADDIDAAMPTPAWIPPDPSGTVDIDRPLLRDNHGEPVDIGRPLTRREGFWLATTIAAVIVGLLGLAWFALWVLGGVA